MATPTPSTTPAPLTGDLIIDVMTTGYSWHLNSDRTIDWSISNGFHGEFWTDPATVKTYVETALGFISYYANVDFHYVGTFSTPAAANLAGSEINASIDGANQFFSSTSQWARGFFPSTGSNFSYSGAAGDVYLNIQSQANTLSSYDPGSVGWTVLLHELGHALGLKHPHDDGGTGHPTFQNTGLALLDQDWATVMSYSDDYNWNQLSWHPATPMVLDVLALQYLYGKNMNTNAGDSIFTLSTTNLYTTIWDASGRDAVNAGGSTTGWTIYLPFARLSSLVDTAVGYAAPSNELSLSSPHTLAWLTGNIEDALGSAFGDDIHGNALGNIILAGAGADTITGGDGVNYLRGEDGNDSVVGGANFDDINGNMGNDTGHGGMGTDWVVGGKDQDLLYGDEGDDIVYGNLGNDTCDGGAGADLIRGGQGNDVLTGGVGNDWLSGDRGDDTITGGAGADVFHGSADAGWDFVTDFSVAQGDRVQLDPGTAYTVEQLASDVVIRMQGSFMVLLGVQLSSLPNGWIFGA